MIIKKKKRKNLRKKRAKERRKISQWSLHLFRNFVCPSVKQKGEQKRKVRDRGEEHRVLAFNVRSLYFFFIKSDKKTNRITLFAVSSLYGTATRLIKRKKAREEVSELNI